MDRKRANRKLVLGLLIMTAASFAFGWALVPLYDVFCRATGIGNAEAKAGPAAVKEAIDPESRGHHRIRGVARLGGQL